MAKPSWISLVSGSAGSGDGSFIFKAEVYKGRTARTGIITVDGQGTSSKQITVSQSGAPVYVQFTNKSVVIDKAGGTATFYGVSNSPYLNFAFIGVGLNNPGGSSVSMNEPGQSSSTTALGPTINLPSYFDADGHSLAPTGNGSSEMVAGIGQYSEYEFKIQITVPANTLEKTFEASLQVIGDHAYDSAKITLNEAESKFLTIYKDADHTTALSAITVEAAGSESTAYVDSNTSWTVS